MTDKANQNRLIPKHGGYRKLKSFEAATLVYDLTVAFCDRYKSYRTYLESPETGANMLICLIHQANYLLDQQIRALEKQFLEEGGFTEKLYRLRKEKRGF